jgi:hypothetical protein
MNTLQSIFSFFFKLNHCLPQIDLLPSTNTSSPQTIKEIFKTLLNSTPPAYPNFFKKLILNQNLAVFSKTSAFNPLLLKKDLNVFKESILKNAYLIALFLKNSFEKDTALCCIAKAQAPINIYNARKVASIIEGQKKKDEALVKIVEVLVLTDLEEAKKIALTIKNWDYKNLALFAVVTAHAAIDLEKASAVARQMSFIYQANAKSYVLFKMIQADVYTDLDQALLNLETLEDSQDPSNYKAKALLEIIKKLIPFDPKKAFIVAISLKDDDLKNQLFLEIIKALPPSILNLQQAITIIKQMKSDSENQIYYKNLALVELVKAHALINPDFAFLTAQTINETIYLTEDPVYPSFNYKGVAFIEIVKVLTLTHPEKALVKVEWIENNLVNLKNFYKNQALIEIIKSLVSTDLDKAIDLTSKLNKDGLINHQMMGYIEIITKLSIGNLEKALELAKSKLQDAQDLPSRGSNFTAKYQSFALFRLVKKYLSVDLEKAKNIAYEIKAPTYREHALVEIAQAEAAIQWEEGFHTAIHIENHKYKIQALEKIAETTHLVDLKIAELVFNLLTTSNHVSHPYHFVCNLTEIVNELNKTNLV